MLLYLFIYLVKATRNETYYSECNESDSFYYMCLAYNKLLNENNDTLVVLESIVLGIIVLMIAFYILYKFCNSENKEKVITNALKKVLNREDRTDIINEAVNDILITQTEGNKETSSEAQTTSTDSDKIDEQKKITTYKLKEL